MRVMIVLVLLIVVSTTVSAKQRNVTPPPQVDFTNAELDNPTYQLLRDLHDTGRKERMLNVPPYDGRMLQMLVAMTGAKHVLEIGTSNGVSTIWMAQAIKATGGRITTMDIDPAKIQLAGKNFKQAGVDKFITLHEGDALKILPTLAGPFDLVFIDAAKEQYKDYLDAIWQQIPKGGVIVAHNAVRQARSMQNYLKHVQNHPLLDTIMLQTGNDGVALSYRK